MKIQPYLLKKLSSLRRRRSQGRAAQAVVLVLDRRLNSLNIPFSMTVEARLEIQKEPSEHPGEEDKFNYGLFIDVDPDRKDNMTVDVHGHVDGGDMDVTTHAATEGVGKADVHAEIHYGDDEDQDSVEMSVFDTSDSSSDQMHLRATHNRKKKSKQSRKMKQGSKSGKKS